jgi:hypothetical protein
MGLLRRLILYGTAVFVVLSILAVPVFSSGSDDQRKDRLLQRVNTYWNDRVEGRIAQNYDYYDPFFRARVRPEAYVSKLLEIKFHSYQIGDVDITENIAKVTVEVEVEIPEAIIAGKKTSLPLRKDKWVEDWIWIDNDWFKVYKRNLFLSYIPFFPAFPP